MVYLGGGAGMAPLRSHLSHLFETHNTTRRGQLLVWRALAAGAVLPGLLRGPGQRQHANFSFHVALSEPQPEDRGQGHTGFIHEVLQREYLATHPDPDGRSITTSAARRPMIQAARHMLQRAGR